MEEFSGSNVAVIWLRAKWQWGHMDILKRNNVRVSGNGERALIFAHGFGCDQHMWRLVAPAFENEYRIVLFDHVGSGRSDLTAFDEERYSTLDAYAEDLLQICDALALTRVILVAHSVSCTIGLLASIRRPEVFERMVLVGPSPCYLNHAPDYEGGFNPDDIEDLLALMEKNYLGWASFFAPIVMQNTDNPALTAELEGSFCSTDPRTAIRFARTTFFSDNRADLARVTVPTYIMQCAEDVVAPVAVGDYLHQHLRGSTLRQLRATGHCPHLSHPHETMNAIRDYLEMDLSHG